MTKATMPATLDVGSRAPRLRSAWAGLDAAIDGLLVGELTNVRWLTGFTGSAGVAVVLADRIVLITDGRYGEQAERQMEASRCRGEVRIGRTAGEQLALVVEVTRDAGRLGFESAHTSYARWTELTQSLSRVLIPTAGLVEGGRRTKDAGELALIEQACTIADAALAEVAPTLAKGRTEAQVRNDLERIMRELGATGPSYETIVASGPVNASMPHHRPTDTQIEPGHAVIIDVGALVGGYHSDMTRTFLIGRPTPLQQEVYDAVLVAQSAGVAAVRPGLATAELDGVCRDVLIDAGFGPWFTHGTGHGVGLVIHEDPFVNASGGWVLQEGDVVTVEPGVYRGDFGGVRVEDLVEVTSTGCRVLTRAPKDQPCLPSPPTT